MCDTGVHAARGPEFTGEIRFDTGIDMHSGIQNIDSTGPVAEVREKYRTRGYHERPPRWGAEKYENIGTSYRARSRRVKGVDGITTGLKDVRATRRQRNRN